MTFKKGHRPSAASIEKQKASWTPGRRAEQSKRAHAVHRTRPRAAWTLENWQAIRRRRLHGWPLKESRHRQTTVPFLSYGFVVRVIVRTRRSGVATVITYWNKVMVINGERAPRWTPQARRAQAERLAIPGRRFPGQPREVLDRARRKSTWVRRLRANWPKERRKEQSRAILDKMGRRFGATAREAMTG